MDMYFWKILTSLMILFGTASSRADDWVQWSSADGGNDHWYKAVHVPEGINWIDANSDAIAQGAYLATITSLEENNLVFSLVSDAQYWGRNQTGSWIGPWIGGLQLDGSMEPAGGWTWVTGEPFIFTNWGTGQPNNHTGNNGGPSDDRINFVGPAATGPSPFWNDWPKEFDNSRGFVMEKSVFEPSEVTIVRLYHTSYTGTGTPPWNRLDTSKTLVKEGTDPQLFTYNNLINTVQGINGIVFDIQNLPDGDGLGIEDFEFQVSPQGAFDAGANPPANWEAAPDPSSITVTPGSPDRVLIQWPDAFIMNRWLRITILATTETGLAEPEVYYIGHLLGETTGPDNGMFTVSFADITPIRSDVGQTVDASSTTDIDKSGTVSFADISGMRGNVGAQLTRISVP